MPPKKANKVPRRWRPADRPDRHTGRSLGAVGLAAVVLVGGVSWAVSGSDVLEGSGVSLGERRTVTADGDAGDRPSSAAAVPVAFEGDATSVPPAEPGAPGSGPTAADPAAEDAGALAGADPSDGPAVTADATPVPRPRGWLLRPVDAAPGSTVLPVADSTTTSSTTTSTRPPTTRPPATSSTSTTTSSTTSTTASTTTTSTTDTTADVEPTSTTDDDTSTTSSGPGPSTTG